MPEPAVQIFSPQFKKLCNEFALVGFARAFLFEQDLESALGRPALLGQEGWRIDPARSILVAKNQGRFAVQYLGRWQGGEWQWSWAGPSSGHSDESIKSCAILRDLGHRYNIREFSLPTIKLPQREVTRLLMLCAGILASRSFFFAAEGDRAEGYILSQRKGAHDRLTETGTWDLMRICMKLGSVGLPINHKMAITSLVTKAGFLVIERGDSVSISEKGGHRWEFIFDRHGVLDNQFGSLTLDRRGLLPPPPEHRV